MNLGSRDTARLAAWTRSVASPLAGGAADFDPFVELVGDARIVLLGEATHGTSEFYTTRARLTERLIREKGFSFVAIEGDWPDASRANWFAQGGLGTPAEALRGFKRFPAWMWRNHPVCDFLDWLRRFNSGLPESRRAVGFHGLDVYSLHTSMEEVVAALYAVNPPAGRVARERYRCFEDFGADSREYALSTSFLTRAETCEPQVTEMLEDIRSWREVLEMVTTPDDYLDLEMNALAVCGAEAYYRAMSDYGPRSWNLRDEHMTEVLERLLEHYGPGAKGVVWAHNSHVGDFRATSESRQGYANIGQMVRERFPGLVVSAGFGTYEGTVTAAPYWDGQGEFMPVPPARTECYEAVFHEVGLPAFYVPLLRLAERGAPDEFLFRLRPERAIGVVYNPNRERFGNYVDSALARRYDAYFFYDRTFAVEPLELAPEPAGLEAFPTGL